MMPKVRIIVPFYNDHGTVVPCLSHIFRSLTTFSYSVVVVNDNPHADLDYLKQMFNISLVRNTRTGSAARARNQAGLDASEDVLVFIDADVLVDPRTIEALVTPILLGEADASVGNYSQDIGGLNFYQAYKQIYINWAYKRSRGYLKDEYWTAIGAISQKVFSKLLGFDDSYNGAAGEDTELGVRLTRQNYRILAVPQATGKHLGKYNFWNLVRNDFVKGTKTVLSSFKNNSALTNNRHASASSVFSVSLASVFLVALLFSVCFGSLIALFVSFAILLAYLIARKDLLVSFTKKGKTFLLKSFFLQYFLDLVRVLAVLFGTTKALIYRSSRV